MQRTTKQRTAILDALSRQEEFRTAQQLHDDLRESGSSVGLATVYRTLQALAESGAVDVLVTDDGEAIYRQCAQSAHHHHLVCRRCRRTVEFQAPELEELTRRIAAAHGYTEVDHTMEVYGLCPQHTADDEGPSTEAATAKDAR